MVESSSQDVLMAKREPTVSVTTEQREDLESLLRRPSVAAGLAKRARGKRLVKPVSAFVAVGDGVQAVVLG
jgi:hypothetical protein